MTALLPLRTLPAHPPKGVPAELWAHLQGALAAIPIDERAVVAFDADGTLWACDVGEAHLEFAAAAGLLTSLDPDLDPVAAYQALERRVPTDAFSSVCQMMDGLEETVVIASCKRVWTDKVAHILPGPHALVAALMAAGVEVWVVSASHFWMVAEGVASYGVPRSRVVGMRSAVIDGRLSGATRPPVPNGAGKVPALQAVLDGAQPFAAFGNSIHDAELINHATVRGWVSIDGSHYNTPEMAAAAEAGGWFRWTMPAPTSPKAAPDPVIEAEGLRGAE